MTLPKTVAEVLKDHVTYELESIDRMYLNLYQPKLVYPSGVVGFFKEHRGMPFVSGALMDPISKDFVRSIHHFIDDHDLDLFHFQKGERKDDIAQGYLGDHMGQTPSSSWVGPRRRPGSTAPKSASTPSPARPIPGW